MTKPVEKKVKKFDGTAECKFCHQTAIIAGTPKNKAAADDLATMQCKCDKAKEYQAEEKKKAERLERLRHLKVCIQNIAEHSANRHVNISEEAKAFILAAGTLALDNHIDSANIKINHTKINLSTTKGNIVLSSTYQDGTKVEV